MVQPLKEQYASSKNLEARMSIYQYDIDPKPLSKWLTEQITPENNVKIIELGCGNGNLWKDLKDSFHNCDILLSDLSEGMLERAKENFGENSFNYEKIDFHNIPYLDKTFDVVISNHNLYHALDLNKVLTEISRVLKDDGVFYSTTNSAEHLSNLRELLDLPDDVKWANSVLTSAFGAETGIDILSNHFPHVEQRFYQSELHINDFAPIANYFKSFSNERFRQNLEQSATKIERKFENEIRQHGYYKIQTKGCLFICKKQLKQ